MSPKPQTLPGGGRSWPDGPAAVHHRSQVFPTAPRSSFFDLVMAEFTARWERGETPRVEDYFHRLPPDQTAERVDLIFREFCLAGWAGLEPRPDDYLARFPEQAESLERLFRVDAVLGSEGLRLWDGPPAEVPLPEPGNEVGPYRLIRELGRGAFARVFLAEQTDLDDRLVVVKISNRVTPEPSLLARAGHPHIVEVLWHGEAEDGSLQILCMPFLGGASLSAVLAVRGRRGTLPGSGRDLLADLDRVSAEGYLPPCSGRPARELMARLSYPGAAAWVVARLAEALAFAFGRGVLHGDVKPSNVLMAADGTPMLLDFNLSVGCRPHAGVRALAGDSGGTLAYMAPERLRAVADPEAPASHTAAGRHRADIYSLGVLFLEMLTGRAPRLPGGERLSVQELASFYISAREHGGDVMIRSARTTLPAGLKSILARCLAPHPADRYRYASELAEDLDLWLADRPLAFAPEPGKTFGLVRTVSRRRRSLACLATGLVFAALAAAVVWYETKIDRRRHAASTLSRIMNDEGSGVLQSRRPGFGRVNLRDDPAETARRNLEPYGVLDPRNDWREQDDFRELPGFEREDLEAWILEQVLRYAHALGERPRKRDDWRRALVTLEQVAATSPFGPLLEECRELRRRLEEPAPGGADANPPANTPAPWVTEYLLGVEAELHCDGRSAGDAMGHYATVLKLRPGSFWANYRAAAVAFETGRYGDSAEHLKVCVGQYPDNAALHRHLAGSLHMDGRGREAFAECEKARGLAPDHAETYLTRAMLRITLKQFDNFKIDIDHYDQLKGRRNPGPTGAPRFELTRPLGGFQDDREEFAPGRRQAVAIDPDELDVRIRLSYDLWADGRPELALEQSERILAMNPDDLMVRYNRAAETPCREDADRDCVFIARHPQAERLVRERPSAVNVFHRATVSLIRQGEFREAVQTARTGARLAERVGTLGAESHFLLAKAYALTAKTDPALTRNTLDNLRLAYALSPGAVRSWYLCDPVFIGFHDEYGLAPFEPR